MQGACLVRPFDRNHFTNEQLSPDYFLELKKMVQQYNEILSDDFWRNLQNMNRRKRQNQPVVPIEIWENEQHLILLIVMPGMDVNNIKITYHSPKHITFQSKLKTIQPPEAHNLLHSELPRYTLNRDIELPIPVKPDQHSISTNRDGVVTCTFTKEEIRQNQIQIPLDF